MKKIIFFCFCILFSSVISSQEEKSVSLLNLLPERTLAVAGSPDIEGLKAAWKQNHIHLLGQEAEFKNFIAPLKQQATPFIEQGKQMLQMTTGFSLKDILAIPLKEVVVAVVDIDLEYRKPTIAISVNAGDFSQKLLDILAAQGAPLTVVDHNALPEEASGIAFATIINGNLIVTSDYALMNELVGNFHNDGQNLLVNSEDFAATKKYMHPKGEVVATGLYVSLKNILGKVKGMLPPPVQHIMAQAHINDIHSFSFTVNLAGKDTKTRFFVQAPAEVAGLPQFLRGESVDVDRFSRKFPASTNTFSIIRLNLGDLLSSVETLINTIDPEKQMGLIYQYQGMLNMLKGIVGFDLLKYQDAFGAEIATGNFNLSDNFFSDQLMIVPIRDAEKAREYVGLVTEKLGLQTKMYPGSKERILYFVNTLGKLGNNPFEQLEKLERNPMALAKKVIAGGFSNIALSYDKEYLYVTNSSQAMLNYLEWKNSKKFSLSGNRDFIRTRESLSKNTAAFLYLDQRKVIKQVWSVVSLLLNSLEPYIRDAGIAIEGDLLPRSKTIAKHFGLSNFSLAYEKEGILLQTDSSALVLGPAIVAVAAAVIMPAIANAQQQARQAASRANLRQMGMGYALMIQDYGKGFIYPPAHNVKFITILYKSQLLYEPSIYGEHVSHWDLMNDEGYMLDYEATDIAIFRQTDTTTTPIVWTKEGIHNNVRLVLFLDSHVEEMDEWQFQGLMAEQAQIAEEHADAIAQAQQASEECYSQYDFYNATTDEEVPVEYYKDEYNKDGYDEDLDREKFDEEHDEDYK